MSKSKFSEGLEGLDAEQFARIEADFRAEQARRGQSQTPDYAGMTDQQLRDEVYRVEREAKRNG